MRFALLGSHPDGLEMASALVESGRHELVAWTGAAISDDYLRRWGSQARRVGDLEEVLADPAVEMILVAGTPANRPAQLRRALQSERDVLCVHPCAATPDVAHEASLIQGDTKRLLLPLLPEALHPVIGRLAELLAGSLGPLRLIEIERSAAGEVLLDAVTPGHKPGLPDWDVLRALGGEVAEVTAFAGPEMVAASEPLLLAGRFEKGGLFRATFLPNAAEPSWRLTVAGNGGRAELSFPVGWPGPAFLDWQEQSGETREEAWEAWDPWAALVERFEAADGQRPTWQDEVRCLELDDAARRSVEKRRSSALEYQEVSEEVGFKGTMTLVGCGVLWLILLFLVLAVWVPWVGWLIMPLLAAFLGMQAFRWFARGKESEASGGRQPPGGRSDQGADAPRSP